MDAKRRPNAGLSSFYDSNSLPGFDELARRCFDGAKRVQSVSDLINNFYDPFMSH